MDDKEWENGSRFGRQNLKNLDHDERKRPRFGRQNFEKILDDDERAKRSESKGEKRL